MADCVVFRGGGRRRRVTKYSQRNRCKPGRRDDWGIGRVEPTWKRKRTARQRRDLQNWGMTKSELGTEALNCVGTNQHDGVSRVCGSESRGRDFDCDGKRPDGDVFGDGAMGDGPCYPAVAMSMTDDISERDFGSERAGSPRQSDRAGDFLPGARESGAECRSGVSLQGMSEVRSEVLSPAEITESIGPASSPDMSARVRGWDNTGSKSGSGDEWAWDEAAVRMYGPDAYPKVDYAPSVCRCGHGDTTETWDAVWSDQKYRWNCRCPMTSGGNEDVVSAMVDTAVENEQVTRSGLPSEAPGDETLATDGKTRLPPTPALSSPGSQTLPEAGTSRIMDPGTPEARSRSFNPLVSTSGFSLPLRILTLVPVAPTMVCPCCDDPIGPTSFLDLHPTSLSPPESVSVMQPRDPDPRGLVDCSERVPAVLDVDLKFRSRPWFCSPDQDEYHFPKQQWNLQDGVYVPVYQQQYRSHASVYQRPDPVYDDHELELCFVEYGEENGVAKHHWMAEDLFDFVFPEGLRPFSNDMVGSCDLSALSFDSDLASLLNNMKEIGSTSTGMLVHLVRSFRYFQSALERTSKVPRSCTRYHVSPERFRDLMDDPDTPPAVELTPLTIWAGLRWEEKRPISGEDAGTHWWQMDHQTAVEALMGLAEQKAKILADRLFRVVISVLGLPTKNADISWDKKRFDAALELAVGSLDRDGDGVFRYGGLRDLAIASNMDEIFSLYLCRKLLNVNTPKALVKAEKEFLERVCSQPNAPRPDARDPELRDLIVRMAYRVSNVLFRTSPPVLTIPNSNKSCVEQSSLLGGKRVGLSEIASTECASVVRPKAILSAGKIRVITIDSLVNCRYQHFNERAFNSLRDLPFVLSGKQLDGGIMDFLSESSTDPIVSGDLEAATDTFLTEASEAVIRAMCENFSEDGEYEKDYAQLIATTTAATFYRRRNAKDPSDGGCKTCKANPDEFRSGCPPTHLHHWIALETEDGATARQMAGQLMGSIVSFPALCIINALTGFHARGVLHDMALMDDFELLDCLRFGKHRFVVNGDDFIARLSALEQLRWEMAVDAIGGIVSRGKTLRNLTFGTVNSELLYSDARRTTVRPVLRPTLIAGLHDRAYKAPADQWIQYFEAEKRYKHASRLFRVSDTLFPSMPRQWGGYALRGHQFRTFDEFSKNIWQVFTLQEMRPESEYGYIRQDREFAEVVLTGRGSYQIRAKVRNTSFVPPSHDINIPSDAKFCEGHKAPIGLYPRHKVKEFARMTYGRDKFSMIWDEPVVNRRDIFEVMDTAKTYSRFCTEAEKRFLWQQYKLLWYFPECVLIESPVNDPWKCLGTPVSPELSGKGWSFSAQNIGSMRKRRYL